MFLYKLDYIECCGGMKDIVFILLGIVFIALFLFTGCTENTGDAPKEKVYTKAEAESACIDLCLASKQAGLDLTKGPCLSNEVVKDWVCDIAHNPRTVDDGMPNNQCRAFMEQSSHNFIELDEDCRLIQFYEKK